MQPRAPANYWTGDTYDYDQYVDPTMPDRAQYADDALYDQAMIDWAYDRNGGRAFAPPTYTDPATGQQVARDPLNWNAIPEGAWRSAGTTREDTTGEYWANYLNNKFFNPQPMGNLGMLSWIGLHPEEAQAALMAVDVTTGRPLLDPGVIEMLMGNGVRMPERTASPGAPAGPPTTDPPGAWTPRPDPVAPAPPEPGTPAAAQPGGGDTWVPRENGGWQSPDGHYATYDEAVGGWMYHVPTDGGLRVYSEPQYISIYGANTQHVAGGDPGPFQRPGEARHVAGGQPGPFQRPTYGLGVASAPLPATAGEQASQANPQIADWFARRRRSRLGIRPT